MKNSITNAICLESKHIYFLEKCVKYILKQTLLPNDIIISKYDKSDNNNKIIDKIKNMIPSDINLCIKTFNEVQCEDKNMEIAYNLCNTDIIIYQDCDIFHKQRNEILLKTYVDTKIPYILHGWSSNINIYFKNIDAESIEITNQINNSVIANKHPFLNKSIIGNIKFPNHISDEDLGLSHLI